MSRPNLAYPFRCAPGTVLGYRADGRPIYPIMGGSQPSAPPAPGAAPAVPAPPAAQPVPAAPARPAAPAEPGPAGGPEALRADLARERDRRQHLEHELQQLRAAEKQRQQQAESAETAKLRQQLAQERDAERARAATAIARVIHADAKTAATAAGVSADRADTFLRLVDLSTVTVADDGTPDAASIKALVDGALTAAPEFRTRTGPGERRSEPGAGHGASSAPAGDLQTQVQQKLRRMQEAAGLPAPAPVTRGS